MEEALKDFEEFVPVDPEQYRIFFENLISTVLERNDQARFSLGNLFFHALKNNKIELVHLVDVLKTQFSMVEDMQIDIPKIKTYLSQIVAPIVNDELENPMRIVYHACEPIINQRLCADMINEIVHAVAGRVGRVSVTGMFRRDNLSLKDFMASFMETSEIDDFAKANSLDWLLNTASNNTSAPNEQQRERTTSASSSSNAPLDMYEKRLYEILSAPDSENNEVFFSKIEKEFATNELESKTFVRALVMSVSRSCHKQDKLDTATFKKRSCILNRFIGKKEELELEALFAIQALDHRMKHQPGLW